MSRVNRRPLAPFLERFSVVSGWFWSGLDEARLVEAPALVLRKNRSRAGVSIHLTASAGSQRLAQGACCLTAPTMSMQLCLVNNNPISTLLITPDGDPLFSVETAPAPHAEINPHIPSVPRAKAPTSTTRIKRLERYHLSTGHTETEIGVIEYQGAEEGCLLHLSMDNRALAIPPHSDASRTIEENTCTDVAEEEYVEKWVSPYVGDHKIDYSS